MKKTTILCGLGLSLSVICVGSLLVSHEAMASWSCPVSTSTPPKCNGLTLTGSYHHSCGEYKTPAGQIYTPTCNGSQYTSYCCDKNQVVHTNGTTVNLDGCSVSKSNTGDQQVSLKNADGWLKCAN
jgi:hypothetical protein